MTEIPTTGLKGLYNRINLFSSIQQNDVIDVVVMMNDIPSGYSLSTNRVMMMSRVENMMYFGLNLTPKSFQKILSNDGGRIDTKEEYNSLKKLYQPEFNSGTFKIGEGYRGIGNTVMLLSRAEFHINNGHDFMLYEYIEILLRNGAVKRGQIK